MKSKIIITLVIICFSSAISLYSCSKSGDTNSTGGTGGGSGTGGTGGTSVGVDIDGMSYSPASISVKVGTTVKWVNSDYYSAHTVTSNNGTSFSSGNIPRGGSFSFTPTVAGSFPYHCLIHGVNMAGTLTVTN